MFLFNINLIHHLLPLAHNHLYHDFLGFLLSLIFIIIIFLSWFKRNSKFFWLQVFTHIFLCLFFVAVGYQSTSPVHFLHFSFSDFLAPQHFRFASTPRGVLHHGSGWISERGSHQFFSGCHPNCFGQARHGCLCQRSFCVGTNPGSWSWKYSHTER